MSIPCTQYMRPNGRQEAITIDRPAEVEAMAKGIIASGCRFEAEVLMTDEVSITVFDPEIGEDIAIEISPTVPACSSQ